MKVFEQKNEKPFPRKYKRIIEKKQLTPAEIMNLFKNNCYDVLKHQIFHLLKDKLIYIKVFDFL